jgi:hypothetical protein
MKASYRKTKTGYYPVIIFNDKSRMTHRVPCLTKNVAIIVAENLIKELDERINQTSANVVSSLG